MNICGQCGSVVSHRGNGLCINGHDNWIQPQDFYVPNLAVYIQDATFNLGVSRAVLQYFCNIDQTTAQQKESKRRVKLLTTYGRIGKFKS